MQQLSVRVEKKKKINDGENVASALNTEQLLRIIKKNPTHPEKNGWEKVRFIGISL